MKKYKILFCDLDGTLIDTVSGETFPKGIWDISMKLYVWDAIKKLSPDYIFIVTNQGGIPQYVTEEEFELKLNYIQGALVSYIIGDKPLHADSIYCPSIDKSNHYRKPNVGMLEHLCKEYKLYDIGKDEMLFIGDASGKPGQFSNSDKLCAENFDIDYLDVHDFVREVKTL